MPAQVPVTRLAATSLADLSRTPVYSTPLPPVGAYNPSERAPHIETPRSSILESVSETPERSALHYAFARRGTPLNHQCWLIEGCQVDALLLRQTLKQQMLERRYPGVSVSAEHLRERGANQTEGRDYLTVQRSSTNAFIYIASQGNDLYISRTTTARTPIRGERVFLLFLLLATLVAGPFALNAILLNSYSIYNTVGFITASFVSINLFLEYVLAPLYAVLVGFFIWAFIRSYLNWLNTRDFWIYLRARCLQNFQADDLVLLERAIDQALRASVARHGIDSNLITPPLQGYQARGYLLYCP